ncbi:WD repeat-containing protein 74 [Zancudomyces culisetae]|uniref:Ribosome biogenesis protein NSA1 n=1 Tax=Zancudomyces culisetae TaxID=1213189 RepID=A0A1R1PL04_ZANCU|nr:WD repeat-containing protein 74 [Zancudomyces culisetae]|eukprot:OMH81650.1 WD repeat-containing protein 74 [Zancudomyces culisetae]
MGNVRVQKWNSELQDGDQNGSNAGFRMKLGVDMCKMKAKDIEANILAFGGNEQELRIYDINKVEFGDAASGANNGAWRKPKSEPLFKAKNIADDYLGLRNPVWITDIDFLDKNENTTNSMGNKLVVSTGYGFIRTYDTLAQKKPVLNLNVFNENRNRKITNIAVSPNQYDVFFTDNSGIICQLDLRKATSSSIDFAVSTNQNKTPFIVESYKGATGAVTSMAVVGQTDGLFLATVSLDRFFRLYRINIGSTYKHSKMIHQTYLKQRMSAVCWDSTRSIYNSDDIVQEELDEVWDKIDTVH